MAKNQFISVAKKSFSIEIDESVEGAKETATFLAKAKLAWASDSARLSGVQLLFFCTRADTVFVGVFATQQSESAAKLLRKQLEKSFHSTSTLKPLSSSTDR